MSRKSRDRWPDATRQEALAIAADAGFPAAHEATGVPLGTIKSWASRAGKVLKAAGVVVSDGMTWAERRDALVEGCITGAGEALAAVRAAMAEERYRDAKDVGIVYGILVDKLQLLSGHATSRHETYSITASLSEKETKEVEAQEAEQLASLEAERDHWRAELAALTGGGSHA
jgi:hypothetical protein